MRAVEHLMKSQGGETCQMLELPDLMLRVMMWTLDQLQGTHAYQRGDAVDSASYDGGMPSKTCRA